MRFIKTILTRTLVWGLCAALLGLAIWSGIENSQMPTRETLRDDQNISRQLSYSERKVIAKSRQSSVRVMSMSVEGEGMSSMSGTYFTLLGHYYIVTVMHGIMGPCEFTKILVNGVSYDCVEYIALNTPNDYAIVEIEKIPSKKPVSILWDVPRGQQWTRAHSLLTKVFYTGYPNTIGPFTLRGEVIGYDELGGDYIYIRSYAWMGASGSGVFDENGKYIGYILAIDVGQTELGIQILDNIVLLGPSYKIDWTPLFKNLAKEGIMMP
jgi:hypothetical protein